MPPDKLSENPPTSLFRAQALQNRFQIQLKKSLNKKNFPHGALISCLLGAIIAATALAHFFIYHSHHAKLF